jgi:hypothetical protein
MRPEAITDSFLDAVRPRLIVVVDSNYPLSERASAKLIARLARRKITVIYTHSTGAAKIEWHNDEWELQTTGGAKIGSETFLPRRSKKE